MKTTLSFLMLCLCACATTPPTGAPCDAGVSYCSGDTAALQCVNGKLVAFTCLGPKGCWKDAAVPGGNPVRCDQSAGSAPGTPCAPEYAGKGHCSPDGKTTLQCVQGTWVAVACDAGLVCRVGNAAATCLSP